MPTVGPSLPTPLVTVSPEWLGGEPVFTGFRVPVKALFDCLKEGGSIDAFVDSYPSVSREHAAAVLEMATEALRRPVAAE